MRGLVSVIAGLACCGLALAQDYPAKPVRILISHSAGSSPDLVMRVVADRLKLRVIAVSSDKRFPTLPETPTIAETYPGLVVEGWFALYGPVGVPLAVIQRLQPELDRILRDPEVLQRVQSYGFTTSGAQTPAWVLAHMQEDVARWRKIAQDVDLQPQ
jgi:tripartite-type tricarboxylate transporter receptor subunit TctC